MRRLMHPEMLFLGFAYRPSSSLSLFPFPHFLRRPVYRLMEVLNISASDWEITFLEHFNILLGIISSPVAFPFSSLLIIAKTCFG